MPFYVLYSDNSHCMHRTLPILKYCHSSYDGIVQVRVVLKRTVDGE